MEPSHLQIIVAKISNRPIGLNPECAFTIYFARVESNPDHGHFAKYFVKAHSGFDTVGQSEISRLLFEGATVPHYARQ